MTSPKLCSITDCGMVHYGRGYCQKHWQSARRNGEFDTGPCEVDGCARKVHSRNRCGLHYSRWRNGDLKDDGPRRRGNGRAAVRVDGLKECGTCGVWKQESEFNAHPSVDGLQSKCRACVRNWGLTRRWKMTSADIGLLLLKQGGCAVCGRTEPGHKGWCVDHDHSCCPGDASCGACIRGILCGACNMALGQFQDSASVALSAVRYLERWSSAKGYVS